MRHIIGIDAGTNSVGWSFARETSNKSIDLIDIGTYIFPIGTIVDAKSSKEKTKNEQRREYRGMKRNLFRYKLRRRKLKHFLKTLKMLPDFRELQNAKDRYQSYELYKLRADAIRNKIPLEEIGRIFLLLNKYRGFKSNSKKLDKKTEEDGIVESGIKSLQKYINEAGAKTIGEYFFKMHEKAEELYNEDKWHNPNELIDERALNEKGEIVLYNSRGIRRQYGRYTGREMYQKEFDLIWKTQKQFYDKSYPNIFTGCHEEYENIKKRKCDDKISELNKFKKTNYWLIRNYCIYYQRPLRSQKKYLSKCQFEQNKRVIPASSPLYQEFRIWKNLSDLRYSDLSENILNQPLPIHWKHKIAEYLLTNEKIYIIKPKNSKKTSKKTYLIDILEKVNSEIIFHTNDEEKDKEIKGNLTYFAFNEALGNELFSELHNKSKLEQLWHHIYIAKDDEWLNDTLVCKWKFDDNLEKHCEIVKKLIDFGLENDYGSYSAKVIKKILPLMKNGNDEYTALVLTGYLKSSDENKEKVYLKKKVTQLKYQELRNPVVEKSVSQVIKIVNAILEKYKNEIDQEKLEIRIESTRELKKPRKERENILRQNREKDKLRQDYADFLNLKRSEGKFNFLRKIEKYDSIINKFELWLEMGMDKNDLKFSDFEKITRKGDSEKHKLWLECNRICPYSSKVISLTTLFSSDIEIEHIIPLSRSLDDSFSNKTLTFSNINKEKGNMTSFEYMQWKNDIDNFRIRIKEFSKSKREKFELQNVPSDFSNDQISNTSYIAKYVKKKLMEISHSVQFTNGSVTAQLRKFDWKLNDLLDKIRFEENTGIDIDKNIEIFLQNRKEFVSWYKSINNYFVDRINFKNIPKDIITNFDNEFNKNLSESLKNINSFEEFRGKYGKKDRTDHRHHAIDSFIIACCTRSVTQYLSNYNRVREEKGISFYDNFGNINRALVDRPFDYEILKQKIKEIIVAHNVNQKLIKSKINKYKTKNSIKEQKTYSPQGSLHKDGIYGKLKNPKNQGFNRKDVYVKRIPLINENITAFKKSEDLKKIYDTNIRKIMEIRINKYKSADKAFNKEALESDPLFLYSLKDFPIRGLLSKKGKSLPVIKNVRVANKNFQNLIQLKAKDEKRKIINENRYVEADGNYILCLYELKEKAKNGKYKVLRDFRLLSFFDAVYKKRKGEKLYEDIIEKYGKHLSLLQDCKWIKQGDTVLIYEDESDKSKIDWKDKELLSKKLYKVRELGIDSRDKSNYAVIKLEKHNLQKPSDQKYASKGNYLKLSQTLNAVKVIINPLGEIEKVGINCFEK